jgi:hypothetical protein
MNALQMLSDSTVSDAMLVDAYTQRLTDMHLLSKYCSLKVGL